MRAWRSLGFSRQRGLGDGHARCSSKASAAVGVDYRILSSRGRQGTGPTARVASAFLSSPPAKLGARRPSIAPGKRPLSGLAIGA